MSGSFLKVRLSALRRWDSPRLGQSVHGAKGWEIGENGKTGAITARGSLRQGCCLVQGPEQRVGQEGTTVEGKPLLTGSCPDGASLSWPRGQV